MGTNPLQSRFAQGGPGGIPLHPELARLEAVERGNAYLAEIGRSDVHWFVHEGQLCIGFRGRPGA